MKKLMGLAALIAAPFTGCDYVEPEYEYGYKNGTSNAEETDVGNIVVINEIGKNDSYPQHAKVDILKKTISFQSPEYDSQVVKYEVVGKDRDKGVGTFSVVKDGREVKYLATLYKQH